jgi:hypothetical protein
METPKNGQESLETTPKAKKTRARVGRKRSVFQKAPRAAWPVRGLWENAPPEEKERAHETCMKILEYWLGKKSKGKVAKELEITPLRVWQLSQQALSGMMAGLLSQPRRRVGPEVFEGKPNQSPAALKKRIVELEKELSRTEDLVRVLRCAPWQSAGSDSPEKGGTRRAHRTKTKKKARVARDATPSRGAAQERAPLEGDDGCAG